jgi:soluble lytic murein transglycosylase-like protein
VESGYDPHAVSRAGAVGLMQLMPDTARRYGVRNLRDPAQNVQAGARYLRDLMGKFDNDLTLALAAYNAGEEAVAQYGNRIPPFRETLNYVPKVLDVYRRHQPTVRNLN